MIWPFKKQSADTDELYDLYNAIVAQSRQPVFYRDWNVPDTITGRFDMVCLHMCLVLRRLRPAKGGEQQFGQDLFDLFFKDMDRSLREMGVGDVSVPKRIQKMGSVFYGLLENVSRALDAGMVEELAGVVQRNMLEDAQTDSAQKIAQYLTDLAAKLDAQNTNEIQKGRIDLEMPL